MTNYFDAQGAKSHLRFSGARLSATQQQNR
jgi:hypothetical protein